MSLLRYLYFFSDFFDPNFAYRFMMMAGTVSSIMKHNGTRVQIDTGKKVVYKGVQKGYLYFLMSILSQILPTIGL